MNPGPSTATVSTASRMAGIDSMISTLRITTTAAQPRNQPASKPSVVPTSSDTDTDNAATARLARAPYSTRDSRSRPKSSVPSRKLPAATVVPGGRSRNSSDWRSGS